MLLRKIYNVKGLRCSFKTFPLECVYLKSKSEIQFSIHFPLFVCGDSSFSRANIPYSRKVFHLHLGNPMQYVILKQGHASKLLRNVWAPQPIAKAFQVPYRGHSFPSHSPTILFFCSLKVWTPSKAFTSQSIHHFPAEKHGLELQWLQRNHTETWSQLHFLLQVFGASGDCW